MTTQQIPFGVLLRRWRERRRMTQIDLALAAESSTRHLSCLETGKARPSPEMIARLAEYLDVPFRDRNALLLSAGFAPAFQERAIEGLQAAKYAMDRRLQAHKPTSRIPHLRSTGIGMWCYRTPRCRSFMKAARQSSCDPR